jgi:murein hydrolase activator
MQATRDIQTHPDTIRRDGPSMFPVSLSVLLLSAGLMGLSPAAAQVAAPAQPATAEQSPAQQAPAPSPEAIKQREQELEAAREQQKKAAELQQKLKAILRRSDRTAASSINS